MTLATFDASALAGIEKILAAAPVIEEGNKIWLDLGYAPLNFIISGNAAQAFESGRLYEIAGPSGSGKTLLATAAMIATQRMGGICIFVDWEMAFKDEFAASLGLITSAPYFYKLKSETWEAGNTSAFKIAEYIRANKLIPPEAPITIVFDSIAAAVPKSVLYDSKGNRRGIDELTMNDTTALARVTSTTLKSVAQYAAQFNVCAIYLNQIRTKPGVVYGDPTTTPGGSAMEFYASTRIFTGSKKIMEAKGGSKEFKGRLIGLETKKNKLSRPFQSVELRLMYDDSGMAYFDYATGYIEELVAGKVLEEKSGRVTWEGKTYYKGQLAKKILEDGKMPLLVAMYLQSKGIAVPTTFAAPIGAADASVISDTDPEKLPDDVA
ncbi:hypothetical protein ATN89_17215 [Comamonas thiooxydans]|uniref:hypothetical protein n=1 Tax=Comamonas thiooxydans TaxID=363952 RepID=UPI0007C42C19|nr:hypothetical protein [Comamonas thiooxydans]OAD82958.1 hypothetical protein ATN89_17215 [Comamonas thiooxydans]